MRIFLSSLGWVDEPPEGNRLRWSYPASAIQDDAYVGLPNALIVERAPIRADFVYQSERSGTRPWGSSLTPSSWWVNRGPMDLGPWPVPIDLKGSQGVRFRYRGPAARVIATDAQTGGLAFDRVVGFGEDVVVEGSLLDQLIVLTAGGARLERFSTLDLFADRPLEWERIAEIGVAGTLAASLDDVQPRHGNDLPTMNEERWAQLLDLANDAAESAPLANGGTTKWLELEAIASVRWEHAVLMGWGFVDGPRPAGLSSLDQRLGEILDSIADTPVAYRVVDPSGRLEFDHSNIVIVLNSTALRPDAPGQPQYQNPEVRLTQDGRFEATYSLRWSDPDPAAIGVRFEEEVSKSPSFSSNPTQSFFLHRTRTTADQPGAGLVSRREEVAFHDVTLRAQATAIDAWDRESAPSLWSFPTSLELRHTPPPPPLAWARRSDGRVFLQRAVPERREYGTFAPGPTEDWKADVIVSRAAGQVQVLRREGIPGQVDVAVGDPWPMGRGGEHSVAVTDPPGFDASGFVGGTLIVGRIRVRVEAAMGADVRFTPVIDGKLNPVLFGAGPATLQQDPGHPELWTVVASFPATALPQRLVCLDPVGADEVGALAYATRVAFLGGVGPIGSPVTVTLVPQVPKVPPPFTVTPLGRDFFSRTLVKVELLQAQPGGLFTLWWADGWEGDAGWPAGVAFEDRAMPGEHGSQKAYLWTILYDVLSLPVPGVRDRRVTYGLQRVNGAGGQSRFTTVQVTLPAGHP